MSTRSRKGSTSSSGSGIGISPHSTGWDSIGKKSKEKKKEKKSKKDSITLEEDLFAEAKKLGKNSTKRLKRLLERADSSTVFSQRTSAGQTLLHVLASEGHIEALEWLIENKSNEISFNVRDSTGGWTELHLATMERQLDIIELLLKQDAVDPKVASDSNGNNALHYLVRHSFNILEQPKVNRIITGMLAKGVDINYVNGLGETPLCWAILKGNEDTVKFLLKNGADINIRNSSNENCLHYACRRGDLKMVQLLMSYHSLDINLDGIEGTPLSVAANYGHYNIVSYINNLENERKGSPLMLIISQMKHICCWLEPKHLSQISQVCQSLRQVASGDYVWKRLFHRTFPDRYKIVHAALKKSWKAEYEENVKIDLENLSNHNVPDDLKASIRDLPPKILIHKSIKSTKSKTKDQQPKVKLDANEVQWSLKLEEEIEVLKNQVLQLTTQLTQEIQKREKIEQERDTERIEREKEKEEHAIKKKEKKEKKEKEASTTTATTSTQSSPPLHTQAETQTQTQSHTQAQTQTQTRVSWEDHPSLSDPARGTRSSSLGSTPEKPQTRERSDTSVPSSSPLSSSSSPVPSRAKSLGSIHEFKWRQAIINPSQEARKDILEFKNGNMTNEDVNELHYKLIHHFETVATEITNHYESELESTKKNLRKDLIKEQIMMEMASSKKRGGVGVSTSPMKPSTSTNRIVSSVSESYSSTPTSTSTPITASSSTPVSTSTSSSSSSLSPIVSVGFNSKTNSTTSPISTSVSESASTSTSRPTGPSHSLTTLNMSPVKGSRSTEVQSSPPMSSGLLSSLIKKDSNKFW